MSWLENRRKKRNESTREAEERQRDEKYLSQVGSYNKTLQELAYCENAVQEAKQVRDRESEDRFRNELGGLQEKRESLKDDLGLDTPAELELLYNSREIKVKGRTRDWIVANYHLTGRTDWPAHERGIPINQSDEYCNVTFANSDKPNEPYPITPVRLAILKKDGIFEARRAGGGKEARSPGTGPAKETVYIDLAELGADNYRDYWNKPPINEISPYRLMDTKESLAVIEKIMDNPAYKNKIRITAKRIEG